ncbi:UDP-3-O-(3-hydroxymyristoyl)glucosamine N-acyltransferase [Pseudoalteromonas sp.]|uniref:UDP-3-O-(3-hydroxymyristoyl)glucosamine N-acyltransferase n=1 Tax=Pseudoalteromonas sp. TaxID=53249 RepID=UPI00262F1433|nr:UDP-3-O-(3-hydroxymyristoyl)glucosamine N-acyltransferase [Pseudoalteromonas sp.]MCP4588757.1 UDP-3-O-(3-hydroxymyristoyl)glucosamine N-acyltransferase [Pseudoalteromonas sp.]
MGYKLKIVQTASLLSEIFELRMVGSDIEINNVAASGDADRSSLTFASNITKNQVAGLIITSDSQTLKAAAEGITVLVSETPRLDFIKVLAYLESKVGFSKSNVKPDVHCSASIGENVVIENGCVIGPDVIIEHNVVLHEGTTIGRGSRIRANSSIGGDGFGFERTDEGIPIRFPHLGGVVIGEDVEVGSNTCIARGTLSSTIIEDSVKIDNLVHIAHNVTLKKGAFVIAGAEVSGGVTVGESAWIGPNACVIQKVNIGEGALVGLGAVVTKNVDKYCVWAGNPAKKIRAIR